MNNITNLTPAPGFMNGFLGNAVTGLVRIPSFMSNCIAVMMVGELAIRGLRATLGAIGLNVSGNRDPNTNDGSMIQRIAMHVTNYGVRPYENLPTEQLIWRTVAYSIIGIVGAELATFLNGAPPAIYNHTLAFVGHIRIDPRSYLEGVKGTLAAIGVM